MSRHYGGDEKPRQVWEPASTPYQRHSETSLEAAVKAEPNAHTQLYRVLEQLRACPGSGLTDEEMQTKLGMNPSTQRPRRVDLVSRGLVVDSGRTRLTRSGRKATVWAAREAK